MEEVLHRIPWGSSKAPDKGGREVATAELESLLTREWLVTNGLGGYASGTLAGVATRRYHGLLIAALSGPLGRVVMLNHLFEQVRLPDGTTIHLGGEERAPGVLELPGAGFLTEFRLELGLPVWRYDVHGYVIEKRVLLPHMQNTVHITYRLLPTGSTAPGRPSVSDLAAGCRQLGGSAARPGEGRQENPARLKLRPSVHFRPHEGPVNADLGGPYVLTAVEDRYEITHDLRAATDPHGLPPLRLRLIGERNAFTIDGRRLPSMLYRIEESRGYESTGDLWSPGHFRVDLRPGADATLIASTESWETIDALRPQQALDAERERRQRLLHLAPPVARTETPGQLVLAADQFLITPAGRVEETARARATGDEVRTVIAGYHWFTDWGRDTMISLEGLTLTTGRYLEAGYILRTFSHYVRDGLIPNLFPEGEKGGLYHTADATLWFFHALARYIETTDDQETLRRLIPVLLDIVQHHLSGTHFGIGIDPADGLLRQGQEGYQLTWMDAKVGDWVVTPRRGKAVEINALWYNALRLLEGWVRLHPEAAINPYRPPAREVPILPDGRAAADTLGEQAARVYVSFNKRFWNPERGYLYDVVDGEQGDDPACRPNQVFAISLPHPVLEEKYWKPVLAVVRDRLLTPVGLRSLSPEHPDYKSRYYGDLRSRDAAYHQGTVWAWLIGPFIDAWLKVHPGEVQTAAHFLDGFREHMSEACVGSISEISDAESPYISRGCIAQAWSVAEVLRCWVKVAQLMLARPSR
jgi:glycogen debranching enzyme